MSFQVFVFGLTAFKSGCKDGKNFRNNHRWGEISFQETCDLISTLYSMVKFGFPINLI